MCTQRQFDSRTKQTQGLRLGCACVLTADEGAGPGTVDALDQGLVLDDAPGHGADPAEHRGRQADAVLTLCGPCGWGDEY